MNYVQSEILNKKIREICDDENYKVSGLSHTGKCIPYIGWYWRDVDFTSDEYLFGDCEGCFIGFMENNKWDYGYVKANGEQWSRIKNLLLTAVDSPSNETLQNVFDEIQKLV
jgi:hypothetical protein